MENHSVEITPTELRKIQLLQLEILKEVDRICRKHHIKYTLCGGSLLGAIRHKGFIPWDDDVDISMLRGEYDRFLRVCKKELDPEKYFVQTVDTDPEYRWIYGKIILKGTTYVRAGQESIKSNNGIFIDIFPRDGMSSNVIIGWIQTKCAYLLRKIMYSPVGAVNSKSKLNRQVFRLLRRIKKQDALKILSFIQKLNFNKKTRIVRCWGLMGQNEKKRYELGFRGHLWYTNTYWRKLSREEKRKRRGGIFRGFFLEGKEAPF